MRQVVIDNVLWSGAWGGAIFNAIAEDGSTHRVIAKPEIMPRPPIDGEVWMIDGFIRNDRKYGLQVHARTASLQLPSGRLITRTIANSLLFPGIGRKTAEKLWEAHRVDLYRLLNEGSAQQLAATIGEDLADVLLRGWREMALDAEVFAWLDRHGLPAWLAKKLIDIYGEDVIDLIEDNPYRIMAFTSWRQADQLACSMGIEPTDERRMIAAVDAVVYRRIGSCHTWTSREEFHHLVKDQLRCTEETALRAINLALVEGSLVEAMNGLQGLGPASLEKFVAQRILEMMQGKFQAKQTSIRTLPDEDFMGRFWEHYDTRHGFTLNTLQKEAVRMALGSPVSVICGGAGVGKTTVLQAITEASDSLGATVHMMALSGRAARRMTEATGRQAETIAKFVKRADSGDVDLDCEPIIAVDEASMVDLPTMYRLLTRLQPGCTLVMLGDPGQLPPISFGVVYHTLVECGIVPKVELTEVYRQCGSTGIPQVSKDIRSGRIPEFAQYTGLAPGVSIAECRYEEITDRLLEIVQELGGVGSTQIIAPLKGGDAGTRQINERYHSEIPDSVQERDNFAVGEPVIWLANNYQLGLMNGSMGVVTDIQGTVSVRFDEGIHNIDDTKDMDLAYAITVHKSQGSQWDRVVVPVHKSKLLDRTLIYTAVTRAATQVVLVGDRKSLDRAIIEPPSTSLRETALLHYLRQIVC